MRELDLHGHDFQSALRPLAAEHANGEQQDQHKAMQDGGKSEARGAFAALRLARAGGADPQRLFAAKVHIPILT